MRALARARGLIWGTLFGAPLVALVLAPTPAAAATCSFDSGTATVSIAIGTGTDAVSVGSGGEIRLDGSNCGAATVSNTNTIHVTGNATSQFSIDLSGGAFTPGAAGESSGQPEIEFTVNLGAGPTFGTGTLEVDGGSGGDHVAIGADGVNLNADEGTDDVDVTLQDVSAFVVRGGDGNDRLTVDGGQGTGAMSTFATTMDGGAGNDFLAGSAASDTIRAGDGTDTVDYSAATTSVYVPTLPDATVTSSVGSDVLRDVENVDGSPAGDYLYGGAGRNVLHGGRGDDTFRGGGGDDVLVGGPGDDKADYSRTGGRVVVNLARGTARGQGHDRLRSIERADGGRHADKIVGTRRANLVNGGAGRDSISVGGGGDTVSGGDGSDTIRGGAGDDFLYGEAGSDRIAGGSGNDSCPDSLGHNRIRGCEVP